MTINSSLEGTKLTLAVEGRLDTVTAPELENAVMDKINDVDELFFDFEKLQYISSAGLRVLLSSQKIMNAKGKMTVKNVSDDINEIFSITGFSDILTIE